MSMRKLLWSSVILVALVLAIGFYKEHHAGHNTSISVSETRNELSITAAFPNRKSEQLQNYLKQQLALTDLPDLSDVEINRYTTPDGRMQFYIKSEPGHLQLVLNREKNSQAAYNKMKATGESIKDVLKD